MHPQTVAEKNIADKNLQPVLEKAAGIVANADSKQPRPDEELEKAKLRAAEKKAVITATLNNLRPELGRNRVLDAETSATYWGVSLPHWRRLYRAGKVPPPIKIGERKLGWRIGDLADGLAQRVEEAA